MSMDVSQLAIEVISKGIDAATKSLNALADASERVESKTITVTSATKESAEAITTATATASSYIDKLQTKVVLLGKNQEQVAHYTAVTKGLTEAEVSHAASLGAQLDAWKALGVAQAEAIKMNKEYDANKRAIVEAEEAATARYKQIAQDAMARAKAQDEANRAARESVRVNQESAKYSEDVSKAQSAQMASAKGLATAQERAANSSSKHAHANKAVELSAGEMLVKLDPLARSLDKLDTIQAKLNQEFAKGEISARAYSEQLSKLEGYRGEVLARQQELAARGTNSFSEALRAFSLSSVMAQRELLVMGREIARGDWTRFVGSATIFADRAGLMNAALIALKSPLTLAVLGVAALGVAAEIGAKEVEDFNKALILTGGYAGISSSQMEGVAYQLKDIAGQHAAAKALTEVANTGAFAGTQIASVAKAALEMSKAVGAPIEDTVRKFEELAKNPVEALKKLDAQEHFLKDSQLERIQVLVEEGNKTEAVTSSINLYADAIADRTPKILQNLSVWERAWKAVHGASAPVLNSFMNIGREPSLMEQRGSAIDRMEEINKQYKRGVKSREDALRELQPYINQVRELDAKIAKEQEDADNKAKAAEVNARGVRAGSEITSMLSQMKGNDRLEMQITNLKKLFTDKYQQDYNSPLLKDVEFDLDGNAIGGGLLSKLIEDAKRKNTLSKPRTNEYTQDAELKRLDGQMKERDRILAMGIAHEKALYEQGKITQEEYLNSEHDQAQDALAKKIEIAAEEVEVAKNKKNPAALEERKNTLKALLDEIVNNEQKHNDSLATLDAKRQASIRSFTAKLKADYEDRQYAIDAALAGSNLGAVEREELSRIQSVQHAFDQYKKQLDAKKELGEGAKGGIGQQEYEAELNAAQAKLDERIAQERKFTEDKKRLDADWTNGASRALQNYENSAHNVASSVETMFSNGFKNMEDALVTFVQTGKLNFSSLANSIISDLIRIQIRAMMGGSDGGGGLLSSIFGSLLSSSVSVSTGGVGITNTDTGSLGSLGLSGGRAAGGPVWSGASFLVGEKGPEIFTPTTQGTISPTGQGGVGGGQVAVTYSPTIHIDSRTDRNEVHALVTKAVRNGNAQLVDDLKRAGAIR